MIAAEPGSQAKTSPIVERTVERENFALKRNISSSVLDLHESSCCTFRGEMEAMGVVMSDRKLFGLFSGGQVTAMVCAAFIAPGLVYAATYTSVVITDPATGKTALVDSGRRLSTYDPIAGYANNPANILVLAGICTANSIKTIFTVPAGNALILKAMHMSYPDGTTNFDNRIRFIANNSGVYIAQFDDPNPYATFQADFGSGFYIHANDGISCQSSVSANYTIYGYYVPAAAVPPN